MSVPRHCSVSRNAVSQILQIKTHSNMISTRASSAAGSRTASRASTSWRLPSPARPQSPGRTRRRPSASTAAATAAAAAAATRAAGALKVVSAASSAAATVTTTACARTTSSASGSTRPRRSRLAPASRCSSPRSARWVGVVVSVGRKERRGVDRLVSSRLASSFPFFLGLTNSSRTFAVHFQHVERSHQPPPRWHERRPVPARCRPYRQCRHYGPGRHRGLPRRRARLCWSRGDVVRAQRGRRRRGWKRCSVSSRLTLSFLSAFSLPLSLSVSLSLPLRLSILLLLRYEVAATRLSGASRSLAVVSFHPYFPPSPPIKPSSKH